MSASDAQNQKRELQAKQNKNNSYLSFTTISNYTKNYQSLPPQSDGRAHLALQHWRDPTITLSTGAQNTRLIHQLVHQQQLPLYQ